MLGCEKFNAPRLGEPNFVQVAGWVTYCLAMHVGKDVPVRVEIVDKVVKQGKFCTQAEFSYPRRSDVGMQDFEYGVVV